MKKTMMFLVLALLNLYSFSQSVKRTLRPGDIYRLQTVCEAQVSPEGNRVAYTLTTMIRLKINVILCVDGELERWLHLAKINRREQEKPEVSAEIDILSA